MITGESKYVLSPGQFSFGYWPTIKSTVIWASPIPTVSKGVNLLIDFPVIFDPSYLGSFVAEYEKLMGESLL